MRRNPRRNSRHAGFTLVELIVVLVIVAIAAAMVVPYAFGTGAQAVSAARMIASDLQYAQNTAITSQQSVSVYFDAQGTNYSLRYNASTYLKHPITKEDYIVDFGTLDGFGSVTIVSADFGGGSTVTFDVLGAPQPAGGGMVTIRAGVHVYRLEVAAATGNVTVTEIGS